MLGSLVAVALASAAQPTDITLSNDAVAENQPAGTAVGDLTTTDPDPGDTHTYALVAGSGSADNASFSIVGSSLRTAEVLDFEADPVGAVRIRSTDSSGEFVEKRFQIAVTDVNEQPTNISLSSSTVAENQPAATVVGTLSSADPDAGATHTYSLVAGAGSDNNNQFQIAGNSLRTAQPLDFETGTTRSIRVRTTDNGGLSFEETFTITITDRNDAPIADDESLSGANRAVGNTSLVGNDPTDGAPNPAGPQKTVPVDLLAGDTDQDGDGSLRVVASTFATNDGGTVTLQGDGDFIFSPAAGTSCADHSDFFDYTLTDQNSAKPPGTPATDTGRVTIAVQDCVWYVDSSAPAGGDGRSAAPLDSLTSLNGPGGAGDPDAPTGDRIFLYDGAYGGGLELETTQRLSGQRHGLSVPNGGGEPVVVLEPAAPGHRIHGSMGASRSPRTTRSRESTSVTPRERLWQATRSATR